MQAKTFIKFGIFILFLIGIGVFVFQSDLSTNQLESSIRNLYDNNPWAASFSFMGIYAVASLIFLPAAPLTITAGALFGPWLGTLLSVLGATVGAVLAFGVARFLGEPFVRSLLKNRLQKVYEYNEKLARKGFFTVLVLRLVPVIPFNGLNFALGVTRVRFMDYVVGTAVGIIPGAFVFVLGGEALFSALMAGDFSELSQRDIIDLGVVVVLFVFLTWGTSRLKKSGVLDESSSESQGHTQEK